MKSDKRRKWGQDDGDDGDIQEDIEYDIEAAEALEDDEFSYSQTNDKDFDYYDDEYGDDVE